MKISDLLKMGLRNLFRRKARTALTVVGMVIGTISIVVMVSIGIGIDSVYEQAVMTNGSLSLINVYPTGGYGGGYYVSSSNDGQQKQVQLDDAMIDQIKQIKNVKFVSPMISKYVNPVSGKYQSWLEIVAVDFSVLKEFGIPMLESGAYPSKDDKTKILLGSNCLRDFYDWSSRFGKSKTVDLTKDKVTFTFTDYQQNDKKRPYKISINENYAYFTNDENTMYSYSGFMDIDYFKEIYTKYANTLKVEDRKKAMKSIENYSQAWVNADNIRDVTKIVEEIQGLGLQAYSAMQQLGPMIETADMLKNVFAGIGLIAMLVSAINIANTMIMSIYERTKEIGVMKVLGCLVRDVKKLFLFEAGMIGLIGGGIGIAFSYLASWAVNKYGGKLISSIIPGNGWYVDGTGTNFSQIPWWLPILATGFAILVGVIAGYIPARRATKISAIEAMKTEG
ncbi:ABC transporter permease [Lachnoclostridium phytofermentans]|uniref:ABC transporter permease n=1 Tax=Lachnoclostridium phytofermentans (strain ATCC 700394 / DSM 18823 / ISDg) TaxID=357809 RepID=A9KJM9_LACP7|nr:FtsX-like permease family protein [Lachnoclostridium phytofermentans]ABX44049.1 protein of unknown function DUF214 [Lachnoclostridium phytofermentans ISDg]